MCARAYICIVVKLQFKHVKNVLPDPLLKQQEILIQLSQTEKTHISIAHFQNSMGFCMLFGISGKCLG